MKEQRWPGDYETISREFAASRSEELAGMHDVNMSYRNDYMAYGELPHLDPYEMGELEPSWCQQLDTVGMQPHSREYLERDVTGMRGARKYAMISGQVIYYCDGIQFSGRP